MKTKTIIVSAIAFVIAMLATSFVAANPYDGVERIGTYYQYSNTVYFDYEAAYGSGYNYIAPPRGGGWFGTGTEWLTGLRSPQYAMVPPVRYTNYYQPTCGNHCWFGGNSGYQRYRASDFGHYRTRYGGSFSY